MWCKILLCTLFCHLGHSVRIVSKEESRRTININPQQTREATMECEIQFEGEESLYTNLVYWFKIQDMNMLETFTTEEVITRKLDKQDTKITPEMEEATDNTYEISALLRLQSPFDENRFEVTIQPQTEIISLKITGLKAEDSGLYVCAVEQSGNLPVLTSNYALNILDDGSSLMITGSPEVMMNRTNMMNMNQGSNTLIYHADTDGYFECRSEGGFPAPLLSVFLGPARISGFGLNKVYTNYTLMGDLGGLQTITPIRWVNSSNFRVNKDMNNRIVRCLSEIRMNNNTWRNRTAEKTLVVYYKPVIDCQDSPIPIPIGGVNIPLKCDIHARPTPEISWTAKGSNVKVMSNDNTPNNLGLMAVSELSTTEDKMIATLTFDEVKREHFQQYDVVAENVAGRSSISIMIQDGELRVDSNTNSASSVAPVVVMMLLAGILRMLFTIS